MEKINDRYWLEKSKMPNFFVNKVWKFQKKFAAPVGAPCAEHGRLFCKFELHVVKLFTKLAFTSASISKHLV